MKHKLIQSKYYNSLLDNFIRGAVATGLLSSMSNKELKKITKSALQGGAALAAGFSAADSVVKPDIIKFLLSVSGGFVSLKVIDAIYKNIEK